MIAATYTSTTDMRQDALGWSAGQLYQHYMDLYERLLAQLARTAKPWAGGLSYSEKDVRDANPDYVRNFARRQRYDFPMPLLGRPIWADGSP